MTLGEKIRQARRCCGLSQGQLADKICVSRSAIAKWETDKGLPDVENLKLLSRILCVSVDSLLEDGEQPPVIREKMDRNALGGGCHKVRRERLLRRRFPDGRIVALLGRPDLSRTNPVADRDRGFLTEGPFGTPGYIKSFRNPEQCFYLVERDSEPFFVTVEGDTLEIRPLEKKPEGSRFTLGIWEFVLLEELRER